MTANQAARELNSAARRYSYRMPASMTMCENVAEAAFTRGGSELCERLIRETHQCRSFTFKDAASMLSAINNPEFAL